MLDKLKQIYATQDNRCTAYPIYVTVQELVFVCVAQDGYGSSGDTEEIYEYKHPKNDEGTTFKSKSDVREYLKEYHELDGEELEDAMEDTEELLCIYKYEDVEVFLTIEGAEEYIKADRHNLRSPRTYVKHFSRRNFEMRALLAELGFRTQD
ncbi:MAG: hypothetical protein HC840_16915 [Leptolyngbyaceae cyanobacterium RM2_2_4]|nr:hypothetical protein [Leptolyngbyaceae cyanobacterium RM2_2_4]